MSKNNKKKLNLNKTKVSLIKNKIVKINNLPTFGYEGGSGYQCVKIVLKPGEFIDADAGAMRIIWIAQFKFLLKQVI